MKKETERRMCWNCEGYVSIHLTQCPYCRSFLQDPIISSNHNVQNFQSNSDLFDSSHEEPNDFHFNEKRSWEEVSTKENEEIESIAGSVVKNLSKIFLFLSIGIFIFGLSIFLFGSKDGLTLHWGRRSALLFMLSSFPLIYWCYRSISSSS